MLEEADEPRKWPSSVTTSWEVRNWKGLCTAITCMCVVYVAVVVVFHQVKYRPWLMRWFLAKHWKVAAPCGFARRNLRVFDCLLHILEMVPYILLLALVGLGSLSVYYGSRDVEWEHFRSKPLATIFFFFYLLMLIVIYLFWRANQWSISPYLRFVSVSKVPLSLVEVEEEVWEYQAKKEQFLGWALIAMLFFAVLLSSVANLFTIPFGECPSVKFPFLFAPCNHSLTETGENETHFFIANDEAWYVAGNWVFIQLNSVFLIAAVFYADYYLHAAADLLVEVHARVAESLMRFGVATKQSELSPYLTRDEIEKTHLVGQRRDLLLKRNHTSPNPTKNGRRAPNPIPGAIEEKSINALEEITPEVMPKPKQQMRGDSFTGYLDRYSSERLWMGESTQDIDHDFLMDGQELKTSAEETTTVAELETKGNSPRTPNFVEENPITKKVIKEEITRASKVLNGIIFQPLAGVVSQQSPTSPSNEVACAENIVNINGLGNDESDAGGSRGPHTSQNALQEELPIQSQHNYIDSLILEYTKRMKNGFFICYGLSVIWIILHCVLSYVFTERSIGIFQSVAILMSDSVLLLKFSPMTYKKSNIQSGKVYARVSKMPAWLVAILLLAARTVLISVPTEAWFLGQSCMYIITAIFLSYIIICDYADGEAHLREAGKLLSRLFFCSGGFASLLNAIHFFCREIILLLFTAYFCTLTALLTSDTMNQSLGYNLPILRIKMFNDSIPQFKFGIFAVLIWLNVTFALIVYFGWKVIKRNRSKLSIKSVSMKGPVATAEASVNLASIRSPAKDPVIIFLSVLAGMSILGLAVFSAYYISRDLFRDTTRFSIIGTVSTLGPAFLVGMYAHTKWTEDDFHFLLDLPPLPPKAVEEASRAGRLDKDIVLYLATIKKERNRVRRRNVRMVMSILFITLCFVLWGITLSFEIPGFSIDYAVGFPCGVLSLVCGILASQLWFNSLQVSTSLYVLYLAHVGLVIIAFGVGLVEVLNTPEDGYSNFVDSVLMLLLLAPAFNLGVSSLIALRDEHFTWRPVIIFSMVVSIGIALGLGIWIGQRFGTFSAILYYLVLSILYLVAAVWIWWNSSKLDSDRASRPTRTAMVIVSIFFLFFLALSIWDAQDEGLSILFMDFSDPLYGLSYGVIAYLILFFFSIVWVLKKAREYVRNSTRISPSTSLFGIPAVAYKVEIRGGELVLCNSLVLSATIILLSVQLLGFITSVSLSPNAGVSISCIALCLIEIFAFHLSSSRFSQFRQNLLSLDSLEGLDVVFDRVLQESVKRCLQIAQQAMMTAWLKDHKELRRDQAAASEANIKRETNIKEGDSNDKEMAVEGENEDDFDEWEEGFNNGFSRLGSKRISRLVQHQQEHQAHQETRPSLGRARSSKMPELHLRYNSSSNVQDEQRDQEQEVTETGEDDADLYEEDEIVVDSVPALRRYYTEYYKNDLEYQMYLRDSSKYEALFHVLFWMRSTQLFYERKAIERKSENSKYVQKDTFMTNFSSAVEKTTLTGQRSTSSSLQRLVVESKSVTQPSDIEAQIEMSVLRSNEKDKTLKHVGVSEASSAQSSECSDEMDDPHLFFLRARGNSKVFKDRVEERRSVAIANSRRKGEVGVSTFDLRREKSDFGPSEQVEVSLRRWIATMTDQEAADKIKAIIGSFVSSGTPFSDVVFPATNGSMYLDWDDDDEYLNSVEDEESLMGAIWHRPSDIFPKYISEITKRPLTITTATDGKLEYEPKEVMQGGVGDCWLLSAISVVSLYPHLLNRVIQTKEINEAGAYHIRLFLDGNWENILVDDRFPCSLEQSLLFDPRNPKRAARVCEMPPMSTRESQIAFEQGKPMRLPLPVYCRSRSGNILWPMLIEKAYAKRYRCYEGLNGGHVHAALVDLTGGFSQLFSLHDDVELVVSGALWERLLEFQAQGALLAAGSPATDESGQEQLEDGALSTDANGIVHGHAYAILRVEEQNDFNGRHQLLQLRDPWGICRWRGPWSKYDKKRWTRRMQKRLNFEVDSFRFEVDGLLELEQKLGSLPASQESGFGFQSITSTTVDPESEENDGVFWISLQDFVSSFKWLYVCQLFNPAVWFQKSISGEWKGVSAGGPPNQPGAIHNPQFTLRLQLPKGKEVLEGINCCSSAEKSVRLFVSISNLKESHSRDDVLDEDYDENDDEDLGEYEYAAKKSGRSFPFMSLLLLDIHGKRLEFELMAKQVVASTGKYKDSRDLSFETKLPYTSDIVYTLFPSLFPQGEEGAFRINVYCEVEFDLEKLPTPP